MTLSVYGDGKAGATSGANTITHFYDRAGIKAANCVNIFQQFADRKSMPTKSGKTFKISKWMHMYDRSLLDPEFAKKGFLTARDVAEVTQSLQAALLAEGAGAVNQRTLQKVTFETQLNRYGEMIEYTDEVELFSEDAIQVRYREELGALANSRNEDLIMMDMLATTTVMLAGGAAAKSDIGADIAVDGSEDANWKVTYDLLRRASRKLTRNRAKKNTSIVTGSNKIGTTPVAQAFYAIVGADVKADLEVLTRGGSNTEEFVFIPVHKYGSAGGIAEGEVGAVHDIRFVEAERMAVYRAKGAAVPADYEGSLAYTEGSLTLTNNTTSAIDVTSVVSGAPDVGAGETIVAEDEAQATALEALGLTRALGNFDVFPILFPTQGAFATVGLKGNDKITFHAKAPNQTGLDNPYGTRGFFSYNFFYAGILLEEEKVLNLLVGASA